jgi:23S rRNA pseudouridine1911/1915/1917 synthase
MAVVDLDKTAGKAAATDITLLENGTRHCLVQCKLHTGRTHQIRVHMAALGHPLVSDEVYGGKRAGELKRQALHACGLAFVHPTTGVQLQFSSSPPADILAAIADQGLRYNQEQQVRLPQRSNHS